MNSIRKIISMILCVSLLFTMAVANVTVVFADTQTVELVSNGGFEQADKYGFPLNWDSDGKNIIPKGDFESNSLSAGFALDGTTAVNYNRAGGGDSTVTVVSNGSDKPIDGGNYALKITWNAVKWGGAQVRNDNGLLPFAYGSDYIARATVKAGDNTHFPASTNKFQFGFIKNVSNTSTNKAEFIVDDNSWIPTTSWQEFSKTFTTWSKSEVTEEASVATDGTFFKRYQVRSRTSAVANAELYVDKFSIEKISRTSNLSVATGNKALMVKGYADGITEKWTSDYANVNAGETVGVSAKVNVASIASYTFGTKSVSPKVSVVAEFDNGAKTEVASYNAATEGFVTVNQNVTVTSGATTVRLVFEVDGEGLVYFDDASITAERTAGTVDISGYINKLSNPGFEVTDTYNFPTGWDSNGKNLITNSDFENNSLSAGYALDGTTAVSYARASSYGEAVSVVSNGENKPEGIGNYALKIAWTQANWGGAMVRNDNGLFPFAYGSDYIARATVKAGDNTHFPDSSNRFQFCFLENVTSTATNKGEFYVEDNSWIPTTSWQEFSKTFTTWSKTDVKEGESVAIPHHTRYQLRSKKAAVANAELYVDKFSIEKVSRSDTSEKNTGSKSLKIVAYNDGIDEIWTSEKVSVKEGTEIAVGASYKSSDVDLGATVLVNYYNGNQIAGSFVVSSDAKSDAWKTDAKLTTVPEGATSAEIKIILPATKGTLWIDDVMLGILPQDPYIDTVEYSVDDLYGNGGSDVDVTIGVANLGGETQVFAIVALYDGNGDMVAVDASTSTIPANKDSYPVTRTVTLPKNEDLTDYYIKTMLWSGDGKLTPLCESIQFPQGQSGFTVNKIFQDSMVLQRDEAIPVYGFGTPGEPITVTMENAKSTVTVDSEGEWIAYLPERPASTQGVSMTVSGRGGRSFTFDDILMGDVLLVSGQSNAAFSISEVNEFTINPDEANDNIRLLGIYDIGNDRQPGAATEQLDLPTEELLNTAGKTGITDPTWLKFQPKSTSAEILRDPLTRDTSAIGYYTAKNIQNILKEQTGETVPVGVITAAVGGSRIERWIPGDVYKNDATLTADNDSQKSTLYNLMIHPLTKFNVKGVLWYQGCANAANSVRYKKEMTYIIESWRDRFCDENLPFIIHQLAGYGDQYALVRDSQKAVAKAMDNVDLTVLIDIGNKTDVHPQAKIEAANRTSGIILDKWYGISNDDGRFADFSKAENVVYDGKNALKIYFENVIGDFYTVNENGIEDSTVAPSGFLIADESGEFEVANVVINDDKTMTIWNENVANPVYVRYAFEGYPYPEFANIYTGNNLPITPFRNDNINVEWQEERALLGSDVNLVLNGNFEKAISNGVTFTDYFQHRATNTSYGQFTIGFWDSVNQEFGNTYASATLKNGTGNASTQVYTALTGAQENMRLPIKAGKYILEADVEATFTDASTSLCMQWNYFDNNEKQKGVHYTTADEWLVTESTEGMVHITGEVTIPDEYDGCYLYAFGLRLVTKSADVQSVKVDNLVIKRA